MARLTGEPLYLVREVGTDFYTSGYQMYAVPKLYTKGPARSVCNSLNKQHAGRRQFEVVPIIEFKLGDPI